MFFYKNGVNIETSTAIKNEIPAIKHSALQETLFDLQTPTNRIHQNPKCLKLPRFIDPENTELINLSKKCFPPNNIKKSLTRLPAFTAPNLLWKNKTRVINGKVVVYQLGAGNPPEVALDINEYNGKKGVYLNYVTPEVERNLQAFLSDPALKTLIDRCGSLLGRVAIDTSVPLIQNLPAVLDSKVLDIENMLKIDSITGRKELNNDAITVLNSVFIRLDSPLEMVEKNKLKYQCYGNDIDEFSKIDKLFGKLSSSYINNPPSYSRDYPSNPDYDAIQKYRQMFGLDK